MRTLAVVALVALFAAELLPWASIRLASTSGDTAITTDLANGLRIYPIDLPAGVQICFQLGWLLLLGVLGTALVGPVRHRRVLGAAVAGLALGQLLLVVSLFAGGEYGSGGLYAGGTLRIFGDEVHGSLGAGVFAAGTAAVLVLAAAVLIVRFAPASVEAPLTPPGSPVLAGPPAGYPPVYPNGGEMWQRPDDRGPLDLTVSAAPPTEFGAWLQGHDQRG